VGTEAESCDDQNLCTDDTCEASEGCKHTNNVAPCDDQNVCTTSDSCSGGACQGGDPLVCNDDNGCTDDSCDAAAGCSYAANVNACDDGDACTTASACQGGACVGTEDLGCDDQNLCTDDACDASEGCKHTDNAAPCDDENACTTSDSCSGGACQGNDPLVCNDGDDCTADSCDANDGCVYPPQACCGDGVVDPGEACDDGNASNSDGCSASCELEGGPECSNYTSLTDSSRHFQKGGGVTCDSGLNGWYRFEGQAGTQMLETCPSQNSCGTSAPGWMAGGHPSVNEGKVTRTVNFHWSSGCSTWSTSIQVSNCGGFYVYELNGTPVCNLRYCGSD
jgi:cysteine-rich repeat protein